jgi:D-mannonate dehydratase
LHKRVSFKTILTDLSDLTMGADQAGLSDNDVVIEFDDHNDKNYSEKDQQVEISEEEVDLPKKKKKIQREEMRSAVKAYRKVEERREVDEVDERESIVCTDALIGHLT